MDGAMRAGGTGGGCKLQRPAWFRWGLLVGLLAPLSACAGASPPDPGFAAPPQDSLAAVIRNLRAGEDVVAVVEAVGAAARIAPEHLDLQLRDAMTHALALSIDAEDSVFANLGSVLEDALGAAWSREELAATMREIASGMGPRTPRQTVAARLVAGLEAGEAGEDLLTAMAEAFTSIAQDQYLMLGIRDEVAAGWARHHGAEEFEEFIRSIVTGVERPEAAAAAHVLGYGRYWETPPAGVDSTGVTHPGIRAALVEALGHLNEIENSRERERNRLEATGDRAGLDALWAAGRGRPWASRNLRRTLAWAVWDMRDPATMGVLADARGDGQNSLRPFGGAAVPSILAALNGTQADRAQITGLLSDLMWLARDDEIPAGSRDAVTATIQGFLSGETLRAMQIADPNGVVLTVAIDVAVVLDDPDLLDTLRSLAADPAQVIRAGVGPRDATALVSDVRRKIGWTPPARSQDEIAAELRTVPLSTRETLAQMEAAALAARIDPELLSDALRSAMIEAWDHTARDVNRNDWYRVRSTMEDGLRGGFTPVTALETIRTIPAGRYGPEQALAVEVVRRLREDAGEDLRLALIDALEHMNDVPVDEESRFSSPVFSLHESLVYAVGGLEDPRAIPALVRSGWGFYCNYHMPEGSSLTVVREILAVMGEAGVSPWQVDAGLLDLAVLLVGNHRTGGIPAELVEQIVGAARGYLDGTSMRQLGTLDRGSLFGIARNAIFLAAVADEPELVVLAEALAADPEAVAALGFTDPDDIERIRNYARDRLAQRPILQLGDC